MKKLEHERTWLCCRENEKMQQFVERMKEFECNHVVEKMIEHEQFTKRMKGFECNKGVPCKRLGFYPNHYPLPCCLLFG